MKIEELETGKIETLLQEQGSFFVETDSAEETALLGQKLAEESRPGQVYTLIGDLGVGKTVFTQGFARGLGITEPVSSPTFTIVQIYEGGRCPSTISTYTASGMWRRWRKSDMRTASTERVSP